MSLNSLSAQGLRQMLPTNVQLNLSEQRDGELLLADARAGGGYRALPGQSKEWGRTLQYIGLDNQGQQMLKLGTLKDGRYAVSTAGTDDVKAASQPVRDQVARSGAGKHGSIYLVPQSVMKRALEAGQVVEPTKQELVQDPSALPKMLNPRAFENTIRAWLRVEWGKGIHGEAIPKADKGNPLRKTGEASNPKGNKPAPNNTSRKIGGVDIGAGAGQVWNGVKNAPNPVLGGLSLNQVVNGTTSNYNAAARTINQTVRAPVLPVAQPDASFASVRSRADALVARNSKFDSVADLVNFGGDNKAANRLRGQVTQMLQKDLGAQAGGFSDWKQVLTRRERDQLDRTLDNIRNDTPAKPLQSKKGDLISGVNRHVNQILAPFNPSLPTNQDNSLQAMRGGANFALEKAGLPKLQELAKIPFNDPRRAKADQVLGAYLHSKNLYGSLAKLPSGKTERIDHWTDLLAPSELTRFVGGMEKALLPKAVALSGVNDPDGRTMQVPKGEAFKQIGEIQKQVQDYFGGAWPPEVKPLLGTLSALQNYTTDRKVDELRTKLTQSGRPIDKLISMGIGFVRSANPVAVIGGLIKLDQEIARTNSTKPLEQALGAIGMQFKDVAGVGKDLAVLLARGDKKGAEALLKKNYDLSTIEGQDRAAGAINTLLAVYGGAKLTQAGVKKLGLFKNPNASSLVPVKQTPTAVAAAGQLGLKLPEIKRVLASMGKDITPANRVRLLQDYQRDVITQLKNTTKGTALYKELTDIRNLLDQRLYGTLKPAAVLPQTSPNGVNQPTNKPATVNTITPSEQLQRAGVPQTLTPKQIKLNNDMGTKMSIAPGQANSYPEQRLLPPAPLFKPLPGSITTTLQTRFGDVTLNEYPAVGQGSTASSLELERIATELQQQNAPSYGQRTVPEIVSQLNVRLRSHFVLSAEGDRFGDGARGQMSLTPTPYAAAGDAPAGVYGYVGGVVSNAAEGGLRGGGTPLMNAAKDVARREGWDGLRLYTDTPEGVDFFVRNGFRNVQSEPAPDGSGRTRTYMVWTVNEPSATTSTQPASQLPNQPVNPPTTVIPGQADYNPANLPDQVPRGRYGETLAGQSNTPQAPNSPVYLSQVPRNSFVPNDQLTPTNITGTQLNRATQAITPISPQAPQVQQPLALPSSSRLPEGVDAVIRNPDGSFRAWLKTQDDGSRVGIAVENRPNGKTWIRTGTRVTDSQRKGVPMETYSGPNGKIQYGQSFGPVVEVPEGMISPPVRPTLLSRAATALRDQGLDVRLGIGFKTGLQIPGFDLPKNPLIDLQNIQIGNLGSGSVVIGADSFSEPQRPISSSVGFGLRGAEVGTIGPNLPRYELPLLLTNATGLQMKVSSLSRDVVNAFQGQPSPFVFKRQIGAESTHHDWLKIPGKLTLNVLPINPNTVLQDVFGVAIRPNTKYYALQQDLTFDKAMFEQYGKSLLPIPINGLPLGLMGERRHETAGKITIEKGSVLPQEFISVINRTLNDIKATVNVPVRYAENFRFSGDDLRNAFEFGPQGQPPRIPYDPNALMVTFNSTGAIRISSVPGKPLFNRRGQVSPDSQAVDFMFVGDNRIPNVIPQSVPGVANLFEHVSPYGADGKVRYKLTPNFKALSLGISKLEVSGYFVRDAKKVSPAVQNRSQATFTFKKEQRQPSGQPGVMTTRWVDASIQTPAWMSQLFARDINTLPAGARESILKFLDESKRTASPEQLQAIADFEATALAGFKDNSSLKIALRDKLGDLLKALALPNYGPGSASDIEMQKLLERQPKPKGRFHITPPSP